VRYGEGSINNLILTNDWFWLTRGHYSNNGTGTICDWKSSGVLAYKHYCKRGDTLSTTEEYEASSKAMDAEGFGEMLDEVMKWMDEEVDDLMVKYGIEGTPKLDGIILDGDATTDAVMDQKRSDRRFHDALKSRAAKQQGGYCNEMRARPCCNHLAKNCGSHAKEKGMALHTSCSCSKKLTKDGREYVKGTREHRGLNTESHALIKLWQRAIGAALRSAKEWAKRPEYAGRALKDIALQGVEEAYNHLMNEHEAVGFSTGTVRKCRLHAHPYTSREYNDCGDIQKDMAAWLTKNIINKIEDIIHPVHGAVSQNASERVGDVALQYKGRSWFHLSWPKCLRFSVFFP
jgi:hypothetical protein